MTFPSRRNIGYRHDLFRAILFAAIWQQIDSENKWSLYGEKWLRSRTSKEIDRIREHRNRAWARLFLFAGHVVE